MKFDVSPLLQLAHQYLLILMLVYWYLQQLCSKVSSSNFWCNRQCYFQIFIHSLYSLSTSSNLPFQHFDLNHFSKLIVSACQIMICCFNYFDYNFKPSILSTILRIYPYCELKFYLSLHLNNWILTAYSLDWLSHISEYKFEAS